MKIPPEERAIIQRREQCRLKAYRPTPNDVWTIGWGHTGPDVFEGRTITQAEADTIFDADIAYYDGCVTAKCPTATLLQHAAMVSLCYDIGTGAFAKSSVCRLHNAGQFPEAAQAFALWNKQKGTVLRELVSRRAEEASLYISGSPISAAFGPVEIHGPAEGEAPLSASRTLNGGTVAVAATAASAAAPSFLSSLSEYSDVFMQAMPYAGKAAGVLAIIAVIAIGYSMYARSHDRATGRS